MDKLIELHLHLDGSLRPETVWELAKEQNIKLPANTVDEVRDQMQVPEDCRTLEEYLTRFDLPLLVLQTREALERAAFELTEDLAKEGVTYAEIRFAPQLSIKGGMTQEQAVEAAIEGVKRGMEQYPSIRVGLILCCMRGEDNEEWNLQTVETAKKDLTAVLAELAPTIPYDDGEYTGELVLDHTTIKTEAAGYTTQYGSVTETKVISGLDRNDMSYVPATTVKDGRTLTLANVEWEVTATALIGEVLVPSQYQAVATYSASTSWQAATGYVTTAEYHGEVESKGIESITYTVVYTGTEIAPAEPEPTPDAEDATEKESSFSLGPLLGIGGVMILVLLAALAILLFLRRKNAFVYVPGDKPRDYKLIGKFRVDTRYPGIDLRELEPYPSGTVAIELKRSIAKELVGTEFTAECKSGSYCYTVTQSESDDWHEFDIDTLQPIS